MDCVFLESQAEILGTISLGDWMEFTGEVEFSDGTGWSLSKCQFVKRAKDPRKLKKVAPKATTKTASVHRSAAKADEDAGV